LSFDFKNAISVKQAQLSVKWSQNRSRIVTYFAVDKAYNWTKKEQNEDIHQNTDTYVRNVYGQLQR
jgi:hypothetical protein